jgi:iron complex outermembrane recepter protein
LCSSGGTKRRTDWFLGALALWAMLSSGIAQAGAASPDPRVDFDLPPAELGDALALLGMQARLQLVYDPVLVLAKKSRPVKGRMSVESALRRLLRGSGLQWKFVDAVSVVIYRPETGRRPSAARAEPAVPAERPPDRDIVDIDDIDITAERLLRSNVNSSAAFGFDKTLADTPRSISVIDGDMIETFGLSAVEDLAGVIPGVFTTTRFGIQGSVDVRNVPADTYFRGMKRLTLQGHGRSVLAALDSIEVVGGPSSPLYGMGKIGGYTNVVPKSGRAQSGKYMSETQGYVQAVGGRFSRREFSLGVGGPLSFPGESDRQGGYYLYGLVEDSDSYAIGVPIRQELFQAASNVDDFVGAFRLETGLNYQQSRTSGALTNRLNQELVDSGRYISGVPMVNLDRDGNGSISFIEMHESSPARNTLTAANQPLLQWFAWPQDAQGRPIEDLTLFPKVAGIPQAMYDYLVAHPEADRTGLLRAAGPGGPLPISGAVPAGMTLDPASVHYSRLNPRHSAAYERDSQARFLTAYLDLAYDQDPDFTVRNQLFFDSMNQYKLSDQPLWQIQNVSVLEDKLTLTRRLGNLPTWLRVNSLFSVNLRNTVSSGRGTQSDYGNHRTDAMSPTWDRTPGGATPNTTLDAASFPWTSIYRTEFSEIGAAAMLDVDLFGATSLIVGGRLDQSHATNTDFAGRFNANAGTSANPGIYLPADETASGWDGGASWTVSLSQALTHGVRPYITLAKSSVMLDGNNNSLSNAIIRAGHVGSADLREMGVKAVLPARRLLLSAAYFRQGRTEVDDDSDNSLLLAYVSATTTRGWQAQAEWAPARNLLLSLYALHQTTEYTPNRGAAILVDASALGFQDVVDANGNVIYPADAFLYGGRARILLPDNMPRYRWKQGNPDTQFGLNGVYRKSNLGFTLKGNYLGSTCTGRLCLVRLPHSVVFDVGAFWDSERWDLRLTIFNVADRNYFRARTGDTLGDVLAQSMPGRRWQATFRYKF